MFTEHLLYTRYVLGPRNGRVNKTEGKFKLQELTVLREKQAVNR